MDIHNECAICLGECATHTVNLHPCNHTYHHGCIKTWLDQNPTCPLCRAHASIPVTNPTKTKKRTHKMIALDAMELKVYGILMRTRTTRYRYERMFDRICTWVQFSCKPGCLELYENLKMNRPDFSIITPEIVGTLLSAFKFLYPEFTV